MTNFTFAPKKALQQFSSGTTTILSSIFVFELKNNYFTAQFLIQG